MNRDRVYIVDYPPVTWMSTWRAQRPIVAKRLYRVTDALYDLYLWGGYREP